MDVSEKLASETLQHNHKLFTFGSRNFYLFYQSNKISKKLQRGTVSLIPVGKKTSASLFTKLPLSKQTKKTQIVFFIETRFRNGHVRRPLSKWSVLFADWIVFRLV
jgi:hypothetical protein